MTESNHDQVQKPRWYECLPDLSFLLIPILFWSMTILLYLLPCSHRCCECRRAKSEVPAAVETTGAPSIVPDDIFGAYAASTGAEVTGIVGDRGLPTPPR